MRGIGLSVIGVAVLSVVGGVLPIIGPETLLATAAPGEMGEVLGGCMGVESCYPQCEGGPGCQNSMCEEDDVGEGCGTTGATHGGSAFKCLVGYGTNTNCTADGQLQQCSTKSCKCTGVNDCEAASTTSGHAGWSDCTDS